MIFQTKCTINLKILCIDCQLKVHFILSKKVKNYPRHSVKNTLFKLYS